MKIPAGKFTSTTQKEETFPYAAAVKEVETVCLQAQALSGPAPGTLGQLIIEEAFAILHKTALYSGMGEEDTSASFAASLTAACLLWHRQWIWPDNQQIAEVLWTHYNDKSETVFGADFSLVLVDLDPKTEVKRCRMVIAQAKKHKAKEPKRMNVTRKAVSTSEDNPLPPNWEASANVNLGKALANVVLPADSLNWQFSRLKSLANQLSRVTIDGVKKISQPSIVYVVWPSTPAKAEDPLNPVLYEDLSTVASEIGRNKRTDGSYLQSFTLDHDKRFREFLLNQDDLNSMAEDELIAAMQISKGESAATILINASGQALSPELQKLVRPTSREPYEPSKLAKARTGHRFTP
jgi:hypothetical protein